MTTALTLTPPPADVPQAQQPEQQPTESDLEAQGQLVLMAGALW